MERCAELAMLNAEVLPSLEQAKGLFRELERMVKHDVIELLMANRESEMDKYYGGSANLQNSPIKQRMIENVDLYCKAISLLMDEENKTLKSFGEAELDEVARIVRTIINS